MNFFVNNNYFEQKKAEEGEDPEQKIPNMFAYFFVLTDQYVFILSSREKN